MGLHRDPSDYAYSPWISDMRRRFWNYLNVLDAYAMLTYGCECCLPAATTKRPRNAPEENWTATQFAKPSSIPVQISGFTNMSIAIIRGILADLTREVATNLRINITSEGFKENESRILRTKALIEGSYLQAPDRANPQHAMATALMENTLSILRLSIRQHLVTFGQSERPQNEQRSYVPPLQTAF